MAYIGKTPSQAVRQRYYYTASGSETSLSGADDNSNTLAFTDGEYVDVSLNGVSLVAGTDYNTSTANTIAGLSALSVNDIVEIVVYDTFSVHSGTFEGSSTFNGDLTVDNLKIDGNTISSEDTNGDVNITPNGTGKVKIDNLSIDGNTIAAEDTNGDLVLQTNGTGDVEINLSSDSSVLNLNQTDDDALASPLMNFRRTSSSPADGDLLGQVNFQGNDSGGNVHTYAQITAVAQDVTNSTEDGKLSVGVTSGSSMTTEMEISPGVVAFPNKEYFHVDLTTLQDGLSDNTTVTVDFGGSGTVKYDTHSKFDSSNDAYLLGSSDGVYLISYSVAISSNVVTTETIIDHAAQVQVATDGSTFASIQGNGGHFQDNAGGEVGSVTVAGTFIYKATTATTKVRLQAYCNTPAVNWEIPDDINVAQGGTVTGGDDARCTFLSIVRIA